ncbi:MAG: FG-GAP-like repeat-containing protein, partial [Verrucomicrobiota bacterium]
AFRSFHWAPSKTAESSDWQSEAMPATAKRRWMFALPLDVNEDGKLDLVIGSKKGNAIVGWLEHPEQARNVKSWELHSMTPAGWIMSIRSLDVDGDGDKDVVFSDRYEGDCGVFWIENPGPESPDLRKPWTRHLIGGAGRQVMFLAIGELNDQAGPEIVCATLEGDLLLSEQSNEGWKESILPLPFGLTAGKGVAIADVNLDGKADLVTTSEAQREEPSMVSVAWMEQRGDGSWTDHRISDEKGRKFDRIEMLDLDNDGDLDLITCEEVHNLGVFWYENPQN